MPLTPAEEHALKALVELGLAEDVVRAHLLKLRDEGLTADHERLLANLKEMDPRLAARAADQLAERTQELAADYQEELERRRRTDEPSAG